MKKLFTTALILTTFIFSCENNSEEKIELSYEDQKANIKAQIEDYYQASTIFRSNISSITKPLNDNDDLNSVLLDLYTTQELTSDFTEKIQNCSLSSSLVRKMELLELNIDNAFMNSTQELNARLLNISSESDLISLDSIYSYFDEFKLNLKEKISLEEATIDEDQSLSTEDKLALIAANTNLKASVDIYVDETLNFLLEGGIYENGRVLFLKKFRNWVKRVVNSVATVVHHAVIWGIQGAVVGFATGGIGAVSGAIGGALVGAVFGIDCLRGDTSCATCIFCQPDPNKACFCP